MFGGERCEAEHFVGTRKVFESVRPEPVHVGVCNVRPEPVHVRMRMESSTFRRDEEGV